MRSLRATFVCFSIAVLAAALLALAPMPAPAQLRVQPIQPKNDYSRFKARYTVIATGEAVQFDLVRPCFVVSGRDIAGGTVKLFPQKPGGYFNGVDSFPKVTKDRHVIVVRIPRACNGETTANGKVPKDLLPYTSWFDDADRLDYGWQYGSEDAYRSPRAKIRFDGATIEAAAKADFVAWQKQAEQEFVPTKVIRSPFGFSFEQQHGLNEVPTVCYGVRRLELTPEWRSLANAAWPSDHPRFWMLEAARASGKVDAADALQHTIWSQQSERQVLPNGFTKRSMEWASIGYPAPESLPTATNGSFLRSYVRPVTVFPMTTYAYGVPFDTPEHLASENLYIDVDTRPELKGFLACYVAGATTAEARERWKAPGEALWRIDGKLVAGQPHQNLGLPGTPHAFFEDDQYFFEQSDNPM